MIGLPETIGRYEVLGICGTGAFAVVLRAKDPELASEVAIKLLAENWAENPAVTEAFRREARLLAKLDCPGLIQIYDVGDFNGRPYIVMPFYAGGTLADRLAKPTRETDPSKTVIRLADQLAERLRPLHQAGIIHRDLSPSNILFRHPALDLGLESFDSSPSDGQRAMVLADLGLAASDDSFIEATSTAHNPYLAPAQLHAPETVDPSVDLYACSVILSEVATALGAAYPQLESLAGRCTDDSKEAKLTTVDDWLAEVKRSIGHPGRRRRRRRISALAALSGCLSVIALLSILSKLDVKDESTEPIVSDQSADAPLDTGDLLVKGAEGQNPNEVSVRNPNDLETGPDGSLYFIDSMQNKIRRLSPDGLVYDVAGTGRPGYGGDGGPALDADLFNPMDLTFSPNGDLIFTERLNHTVRRIGRDGLISTIAGTGVAGFSGDGGPASEAQLYYPWGVDFLPDGRLVVADSANSRLRVLDFENGTIDTMAGNGEPPTADFRGGSLQSTAIGQPSDVDITDNGDIMFASLEGLLYRLDVNQTLERLAGTYDGNGYSGDGGPAILAQLNAPNAFTVGPDGSIYIADTFNSRIRRIGPGGEIETIMGNGSTGFAGDGGPASQAVMSIPTGIITADDAIYVSDYLNNRIRKIDSDGEVDSVIGAEPYGFGGEGSPADEVPLGQPNGLALSTDGTVYFTDFLHNKVRTVEGDGVLRSAGPSSFELTGLTELAPEPDGSLLVGTNAGQVLRLHGEDPVQVVAGNPIELGPVGEPIATSLADFVFLAHTEDGILVSDSGNHRVLLLTNDGSVRIVAGTGDPGFSGDEGPATQAQLNTPTNLAIGPDRAIYVTDLGNARIRRIAPDGTISTVAGTGVSVASGDGGPAIGASFVRPYDIAFDSAGRMYVLDNGDPSVRRVGLDGIIESIIVDTAQTPMKEVDAIAVGSAGTYVADGLSHLIYVVDPVGKSRIVAGLQ